MASAAEVPNIYDLFISDGTTSHGYVLDAGWTGGETSNAAEKAIHSYSPTFVPRTNTEGNYGDDSEDFFLTWSQNDWSQGEQRKYQSRGSDLTRRYWKGSSIDVLTPGQVSIRPQIAALSFASESPEAMCYTAGQSAVALAGASNLYTITADGTVTDEGAHGLGATPSRWGMTSDGTNTFITTEATDTVGVRRFNGVSTFSTFSATGSSALEYLNNAVYGLDKDGILRRYSTAGVATTLHTFQRGEGTAMQLGVKGRLRAFGGKLLILLTVGPQVPELWIYDGVGVSLLHRYSANFVPHGMEILNGTVFVGGYLKKSSAAFKPVVYYLASGTPGKLWEANEYGTSTSGTDLTSFDEKLVFNDSTTSRLMIYSPDTGGVSSIGSYTATEDVDQMVVAADSFLVTTQGGGTDFQTPALVQSNGIIHSSVTSSKTVSWPSPTTAGNTLLLAVYIQDLSGSPSVSTPSGWTLVESIAGEGLASDQAVYLFKLVNASSRSGAQAVAWTSGTAVEVFLQLFEYSGTGIEDVAAVSDTGTGTSASTGTTGTTTQDEELWFALIGWLAGDSSTISNPTNDFVEVRSDEVSPSADSTRNQGLTAFAKNVAATGTASMGATLGGSQPPTFHWMGLVATFKAKAPGEGYLFPDDETAVGGVVTSSLIDFDSHLDKLFRGIKIDYDEASDGDGGSVDIAYVVDDLTEEYTTLQEEAVSGTEYSLGSPGNEITGRSISIKITENKGSSTAGPLLKRIYVRAAPQIEQRHRGLYHLACHTTTTGEDVLADNSGARIPRTGKQMVQELRAFADGSTLLTFKDHLHEYTGVIERLEITQTRAGPDPSYVVTLVGREV